ncbi:general transcription factor 3C polypeptide 2 [Neosynchiropus ocellatus]
MEPAEVTGPAEEDKPAQVARHRGEKKSEEADGNEEKSMLQPWDLTPSSRGRLRRTNPKYSAYETKEMDDEEIEKLATESPPKKDTPAKTPKKRGRPSKSTHVAAEGDQTSADVQMTPGSEGSTADGAVQEINGTPKPKRKYVRRKTLPKDEPVLPPESDTVKPEEDEVETGGRRKRGAAKKAMQYLRTLVSDEMDVPQVESTVDDEAPAAEEETKSPARRRGRQRKHSEDETADDDFIPEADGEEEEEDDDDFKEEEEADQELWSRRRKTPVSHGSSGTAETNHKFVQQVKKIVLENFIVTKKFRKAHHSDWVFPDWLPSTHSWTLVPQSDVKNYLPEELQSAAFKVSREGIQLESAPETLRRFGSVPANTDRWDMHLFTGGPVWAMEWCPTPDGAVASQFLAIASHLKMEERHVYHRSYSGVGLVQLWDLGQVQYDHRPESQPVLAYGLAQDKGFIWQIKWCPSGCWEAPLSRRKAPLLPRLGLLAVASSNSVVTIYSLPHPDTGLQSHAVSDGSSPPIFKVEGVVTLKLGSLKSPRLEQSGQVLSMDWLNTKPHDIMAIGFYDGTVGLWSLTTASALLRVREPDNSLSLLPYRCFLAHDRAVRALSFCPASRNLLATAGEDRYMKTWDLNRLYNPVTATKRCLSNEIHWPLNAPGIMFSQENGYSPVSSHGVHYYDHVMGSLFPIPRSGTMWSISFSDWLNCLVTSDVLGEVILAFLPPISVSPTSIKRTIERRVPLYISSLVPHDTPRGENGEQAEANHDHAEETSWRFPSYREAAQKFYLHLMDVNMETLARITKRPLWTRMKQTEMRVKMEPDQFPLSALHKVRFSPNMASHLWLASGGQAGLVRLNCLRSMCHPEIRAAIQGSRAQRSSLSPPEAEQL